MAFLFSHSLVGQGVPLSHVAASGSRRILLRKIQDNCQRPGTIWKIECCQIWQTKYGPPDEIWSRFLFMGSTPRFDPKPRRAAAWRGLDDDNSGLATRQERLGEVSRAKETFCGRAEGSTKRRAVPRGGGRQLLFPANTP